jgi:hypothetical protein
VHRHSFPERQLDQEIYYYCQKELHNAIMIDTKLYSYLPYPVQPLLGVAYSRQEHSAFTPIYKQHCCLCCPGHVGVSCSE